MKRYTVDDLVGAMVSARRFAGAHEDLQGYHAARLHALQRAFGVGDAPDRSVSGNRALEHLIDSCLRSLLNLESPFEGYMEAPRVVIELYAEHGQAIQSGLEEARRAVEGAMAHAVRELYGIPEGQSVSGEDLMAHGFDPATPEPDEWEYW